MPGRRSCRKGGNGYVSNFSRGRRDSMDGFNTIIDYFSFRNPEIQRPGAGNSGNTADSDQEPLQEKPSLQDQHAAHACTKDKAAGVPGCQG